MSVDAVLFDYGGILTGPVRHSITAWLAADGIEPASFTRALRAWLSVLVVKVGLAALEDGT